jgi:hypothetical protein
MDFNKLEQGFMEDISDIDSVYINANAKEGFLNYPDMYLPSGISFYYSTKQEILNDVQFFETSYDAIVNKIIKRSQNNTRILLDIIQPSRTTHRQLISMCEKINKRFPFVKFIISAKDIYWLKLLSDTVKSRLKNFHISLKLDAMSFFVKDLKNIALENGLSYVYLATPEAESYKALLEQYKIPTLILLKRVKSIV